MTDFGLSELINEKPAEEEKLFTKPKENTIKGKPAVPADKIKLNRYNPTGIPKIQKELKQTLARKVYYSSYHIYIYIYIDSSNICRAKRCKKEDSGYSRLHSPRSNRGSAYPNICLRLVGVWSDDVRVYCRSNTIWGSDAC